MKTEKITIDDGLLRLDINGNGLLIFNPSDLNLYHRFFDLLGELPDLEKKYVEEVEAVPEDAAEDVKLAAAGREMTRASELDSEVKSKLNAVFGGGADFDKLLGGVNVMAFGRNGERIITNVLEAIKPYLDTGVKSHVDGAVSAAKTNRAQRRAKIK